MNSIRIKNQVYIFKRLEYESNNSYYLRKDFFTKIAPSSEKEYKNTINMSIVFANITLNGCSYPTNVIEELKKYMDKISI